MCNLVIVFETLSGYIYIHSIKRQLINRVVYLIAYNCSYVKRCFVIVVAASNAQMLLDE